MTDVKLLTPEQVAERLQISRWTVMDYLRAGRTKGHKVGRLWRIKAEDLDAFLEASPVGAMAASLEAINEDIQPHP
jgi:excisionase family DNA binding protein